MDHPLRKPLMALALAGALTGASHVLAAAPPAPAPAAPESQPQPQQPADVSDAKLRQFAKAAEGVQKIQQDYTKKAESLQKDAEKQIVASVEEAGMSVTEFTELVALLQNDPNLARRLSELQQQ